MTVTFQDMGLSQPVSDAIRDLGYINPTPIQQQAIPVLLKGTKDFVGLAQTGTGKTAAFGLPLLSLIDTSIKQVQGLVICPTRELCMQIAKDFVDYGKYMNDFHSVAVYGGSSIENQIKQKEEDCIIYGGIFEESLKINASGCTFGVLNNDSLSEEKNFPQALFLINMNSLKNI